jgi:hypothetical protein
MPLGVPDLPEEINPKIERAIKSFLKETIIDRLSGYSLAEFDISAPRIEDMQRIRSGDFEIRDYRTTPRRDDDQANYHFYVGGTEFHITGRAADRVRQMMESS